MRHLILSIVVLVSGMPSAAAQHVPARDLLHMPIGTMDGAPALGNYVGDGFGNPATIALDGNLRARVGAVALQTPTEQGVSAQLIAASVALPGRLTAGASILKASVADVFRTETDPQTIGEEIPYGTTVYSLTIARDENSFVTEGLAVRYRAGEVGSERRGAFGLDAGLVVRLPLRHARLGVSSFLWRPANADEEVTTLHLGGDFRVAGLSVQREGRGGYAVSLTEGGQREEYFIGSLRYDSWEGRAALVRTTAFGSRSWRPRLGVLLHYSSYVVGVAREENSAGLGATYQFTLGAVIH
jgi:hypothetical protein